MLINKVINLIEKTAKQRDGIINSVLKKMIY